MVILSPQKCRIEVEYKKGIAHKAFLNERATAEFSAYENTTQ